MDHALTFMFQEQISQPLCVYTWTLLDLVIFGRVYLTWMVKACISWTTNQLIQLLVN